MALDPNISLGVRVPQIALPQFQIQSPLERFQKVQSLRNLMAQGQLQQMNIQQTQLENEALREKARRTEALASLFASGKRPTDDQIRAVGGPEAAAQIKSLYDADKSQFEAMAEGHKQLVGVAQGIQSLPENQRDFAYRAARSRLHPTIQAQMPEQYPGHDWIGQQIQTGFTTQDYFNNIRANAEEQRKAALAPAQKSKAQAEADEAEAKAKAAQLKHAVMVMPNTKDAWEKVWYPALPAALKADISPTYSSEEADRVRAMLVLPTAAESGKDIPFAPAVFQQKKDIARAQGEAQLLLQRSLNQPLIDQANADPTGNFYRNLPSDKQSAIAPYVTNPKAFAKTLSDSELGKLNTAQKALNAAQSLKTALGNPQFSSHVGPLTSLSRFWPGSTDTLTMQAKVNMVRQMVGKAFEEGVLRKEDETKYEKILPNITDAFPVANNKIDQVLSLLQTDIGTYKQQLVGAGRQLPADVGGQASAATAPTINTKEEWDKLPKGAKYIDAQEPGKVYTKR